MSYSDFAKRLRRVVNDYYAEGVLLSTSLGNYIQESVPNNRKELLRDIVKLVMFTDMLDENTRVYLSHADMSYKDVTDYMNNKYDTDYKDSQIKSKIWHNIRKLSNLLGNQSLQLIISYRNNDITVFRHMVSRELLVRQNNLSSKIALDLSCEYCSDNLSDEAFEQFVEFIRPYTQTGMLEVKRGMSEQMLMYFRYINENQYDLTGKDLERYKALCQIIN